MVNRIAYIYRVFFFYIHGPNCDLLGQIEQLSLICVNTDAGNSHFVRLCGVDLYMINIFGVLAVQNENSWSNLPRACIYLSTNIGKPPYS